MTQPWVGTGGGTSTTAYTYDVQDHLGSVTDANGNLTSYVYSGRDLMTRQVSPVSGETDSTYNEHGELTAETDARAITMHRTIDALDRVSTMTYPNPNLNVTYQYDTGSFAKGRLTGLTRNGGTIAYVYDRFGRAMQDGTLAYTYDANGNRTSIGYLGGGMTASYAFDFADREQSLSLQIGANPALALAGPASYEPFGPLASLPLGNGLTETRTYDGRYLPASIHLAGSASTLLNWSYGLDAVGNVNAITDTLNSANNRTYGYLDFNYFLTQGNGPWGTRSWTYDKIGNRLTEVRGGVTDTYTYVANGAVQTPKLGSIALGSGGTRTYAYDADGNTIQTVDPTQQLDLIPDAANRLTSLRSVPSRFRADMLYDGRGFLRQAHDDGGACTPTLTVPTYSSEGRLERRDHFSLFAPAGPALDTTLVLYFAGRPVALYQQTASSSKLTYLTTDHLGTPIAATTDTGLVAWQGGFEPFGADWSGADGVGVFLRFPGQWEDQVWVSGGLQSGLYFNLNRWFYADTGRYSQQDPLGGLGSNPVFSDLGHRQSLSADSRTAILKATIAEAPLILNIAPNNVYSYVDSRPISLADPLGLAIVYNCGCKAVKASGNVGPGQGKGPQVFFFIPPSCQPYGGRRNPAPGTGKPGVTDIDFVYEPDGTTIKLPGTDTFPTFYLYEDCRGGFYTSPYGPGADPRRDGQQPKFGCCCK